MSKFSQSHWMVYTTKVSKNIHKFFWRWLFVLFIGTMIIPAFLLAHVEPEDGKKVYKTTLELTGLSLVDDDNFIGPAKVLFDYVITPTDPKHNQSKDLTTYPVTAESGKAATFAPIKVYSHEQCGCEQNFDLSVSLLDHSPALTALGGIARGGIKAGTGFFWGGFIGVGTNLLGQLADTVMEGIIRTGLSPEEREQLLKDEMRRQSETLGSVKDTKSTPCIPSVQDFTAPVTWNGAGNGTLSYRVTKQEMNRACIGQPVVDGIGTDDEDEKEDRPWCEVSTGKVLVEGEYHCPPNAVSSGQSCVCREGYEWVYEDNHCEGCQKTKSEDCLNAVREIIDANTGNMSPRLSFEGDDLIKWEEGPLSCKQQSAVLADWSRAFADETPKNRKQCTRLEFVRGDAINAASCGLEFFWRYK